MKICFFNKYGFGDNLFSQPFIKHFCELNKSVEFYYFIFYGHSLFRDISNLKYIGEYENKYNTSYLSHTYNNPINFYTNVEYLKNLFIENHDKTLFTFNYKNSEYIAFNTWCFPLGSPDIDPDIYKEKFYAHMQTLSSSHGLNLNLGLIDDINILPTVPYTETKIFDEWYKEYIFSTSKGLNDIVLTSEGENNSSLVSVGMKNFIVFIYNYIPRSCECMPIENLNNFIKNIALLFTNIIFIVPHYYPIFEKIPNIKACNKDFDCKDTPDCENLLMIEKINKVCNIIISAVTGGSWIYFNSSLDSQQNKKYIINYNQYSTIYKDKLNKWYKHAKKYNKSEISDEIKDIIEVASFEKIIDILNNTLTSGV
jgi:hypothetical protein